MSESVRSGATRGCARRVVAAGTVVGVATVVFFGAGVGPASAAEPKAQSVGRFLDGSLGSQPLEAIADVVDARAKAPGKTSVQDPFDVRLFDQATIPLTDAISLPTSPAADAGVANQVAHARLNGASLGASGTVTDDGGVSAGDDNHSAAKPATVNLTGAAFGSTSIPALPAVPGLPGGSATSADALGGITATVRAVWGKVGTRAGGSVITPQSGIAGLRLNLGSPALGAVLTQLKSVLTGSSLNALPVNGTPLSTLLSGTALPKDCALSSLNPSTIDFHNGVTIDPGASASITIDVGTLLKTLLGTDISNLSTSNFDLTSYLVEQLPSILSKGLTRTITGITTGLNAQFKKCASALALIPVLGPVLSTLPDALDQGQDQFVTALEGLGDQFGTAGGSGLAQLADGLENLLDIGLNVQSGPGIEPRNKAYPFTTNLAATPDQSTPVVLNQTLVRAIEINILDAAGSVPSLPIPGLPAAGGNSAKGVLNLALGNAAAGPSLVGSVVPPTSTSPANGPTATPTNAAPNNAIPTGIPAGNAAHPGGGGLPVLPLVAVLALLTVSAAAYHQLRGNGWRRH